MPTTNKCSLCGEFKLKEYFADNHSRCGECEFHLSNYKAKLYWSIKLNEEDTIRLQEQNIRQN